MSAWLSLTILMVVIFHICTTATESISSLDTMAIYDGLLAPENIIGTNLQVTKTIVYGPSRSSFCLSLAFCVDHLSINPTKRRVQQCTTRTIAKLLRKIPQNLVNLNFEEKNPQNLVNFVASVVGWALLVPLYQPQERVSGEIEK